MKKLISTIITGLITFVFTSCERSEIQPIGSGQIPQKVNVSVLRPQELENTNDFEPITKASAPQIAERPITSFKIEE
jgi:hypothetical protein